MKDIEPGEPAGRREQASNPRAGATRRLAEAPSSRFAKRGGAEVGSAGRSALPGPLLRASVVAGAGAVVLVVVGALLASTAGLLFAAGATGGATGLVLARAAVPLDGSTPAPRRTVTLLAMTVAVVAVVIADVATWIVARGEGGTLGPLDYLLTTYGLFVPGELVLGAVGAAWGARSGPVQS